VEWGGRLGSEVRDMQKDPARVKALAFARTFGMILYILFALILGTEIYQKYKEEKAKSEKRFKTLKEELQIIKNRNKLLRKRIL